jgi:hypothetical protein
LGGAECIQETVLAERKKWGEYSNETDYTFYGQAAECGDGEEAGRGKENEKDEEDWETSRPEQTYI